MPKYFSRQLLYRTRSGPSLASNGIGQTSEIAQATSLCSWSLMLQHIVERWLSCQNSSVPEVVTRGPRVECVHLTTVLGFCIE